MVYFRILRSSLLLSFVVFCGACADENTASSIKDYRPVDLRTGTRFLPATVFDAPTMERIQLPTPAEADAIWGATGRDDQGRIYLGVSSHGGEQPTAWLYQYDPMSGALRAQGDVVSELRRAGILARGERQNKLHSKIYQANDGYLYFSSFDEEGESSTTNPLWGGHLWRKQPDDLHWEHLLSTPEALVAVNTAGRFVYALGFWDHVLYRYDTANGSVARVVVGSVPGHSSRNVLVDLNENVYVPRIVQQEGTVTAYLDQYDPQLTRVASSPMPAYLSDNMQRNEGIVAYVTLRDGTIAFLADKGQLFTLSFANGERTGQLRRRGFMHPTGEAQMMKSLFSFDGDSLLGGLARDPTERKRWQWVIHELDSGVSAAKLMAMKLDGRRLLYGSLTRDDAGAFYVAGRLIPGQRRPNEPLLLKLSL